jgi:hypothetical protein
MFENISTLDVGCGPHKLPNAIGIDMLKLDNVDVVHDLNAAGWPLPDNHFKKIRCQHAIEHIQRTDVLAREMYRVAKDGCEIDFITPHYSSYASWGDPTHYWHFSLASIPKLFEMQLPKDSFEVTDQRLKWTGGLLDFFGWLIYKMSRKTYEKRFAWIFPANEIYVSLRIRKSH